MDKEMKCPCCSGKLYKDCCAPYHQGKEAESAETLMRSRYCAYALNHVDYLIRTTHPRNPCIAQNLSTWKQEIVQFALNTDFQKLEVLDSKEFSDRATVVFIAHLEQNGLNATFTERSFFAKVEGRWLYVNGDLFPGEKRNVKA